MKRIIPLLFLLPHLAFAAFVQQVEISSSASGSQSLPAMTVTANDCLVLVLYGPKPTDSETITGATFTLAASSGGSPSSYTLSAAPSSGNTTASIPTGWTGGAGSFAVWFSDNETRYATITSGGALSWSTPLTGSSTTTVYIGTNDGIQLYYEEAAAGGSTSVSITPSGTLYGALLQEYSGCATTGALLAATAGLQAYSNTGTGGGTDSVRTDTMTTASTPSDVVAFTMSNNGGTTSTSVTAGTGYTGQASVFSTNGNFGYPENEEPGSGTSFTPTWTGTSAIQYANMISVALAFKAASGGSCTHDGITSAGALAVPNGTSGSYQGKTGAFVTPDCSTVNYKQPTVGNFGTN